VSHEFARFSRFAEDFAKLPGWWGGPPGPQLALWPACRRPDRVDFGGEERVQGTRADQGVRPTKARQIFLKRNLLIFSDRILDSRVEAGMPS